MIAPPTRIAALKQLADFVPMAGLYARDRNHVKPGHGSVSRLSPAIRHRLITEEEVVAAVLAAHPFSRVEKFVQEVYWRRYWKSWLSLRPQVWNEYRQDCDRLAEDQAVLRIVEARSGNSVIDHFTNELITTGYLHNHARMWFAAWWVHEARLPWQLGAAFFYRHLLDGDPASNTLSWRWVAGWQTPGKTYLARRTNLEKYLAPELLDGFGAGLAGFENPQAVTPENPSKPSITRPDLEPDPILPGLATGLWIHEEDLAVETSPLGGVEFPAVLLTADSDSWARFHFSTVKQQWIGEALRDAAARAKATWRAATVVEAHGGLIDALTAWAHSHHLRQVVALRPEIGPLHDSLPAILNPLARSGIRLVLMDRPEDLRLRPLATSGFFNFWKHQHDALAIPTGKST